jgi:ABC-type bacteriocin/lantibiotic exporter with double-glycine peptidase domain
VDGYNVAAVTQLSLRWLKQPVYVTLLLIWSADHIIVLEHGRIVVAGSHRELMDKRGLHFHLIIHLLLPVAFIVDYGTL